MPGQYTKVTLLLDLRKRINCICLGRQSSLYKKLCGFSSRFSDISIFTSLARSSISTCLLIYIVPESTTGWIDVLVGSLHLHVAGPYLGMT